jgi:hypothetical protein
MMYCYPSPKTEPAKHKKNAYLSELQGLSSI